MPNRPPRKKKRAPATPRNQKPASHKIKSKTNWPMLIIIGLAIAAFVYTSIPQAPASPPVANNRSSPASPPRNPTPEELFPKPAMPPVFTKEGTATISRDGQELAALDIEFADDPYAQAYGMMYRVANEDNQGMIFPMGESKIQSFYMRNTYLPLDIIFLDTEQRIVNIGANAVPETLDQVTSTGPAAYVLEINGGLGAELGLEAGDQVSWVRE